MNTYHKIHSIYKRDPKTNYSTFLEGEFSRPEFNYLFYSLWMCTEKVDGTNVRVIVSGDTPLEKDRMGHIGVDFKGKSDKAQIPVFLLEKLKEIFYNEYRINKMYEIFQFSESGGFCNDVCLYGEGYGARINKGGIYIPDGVDFILFDVKINDVWLEQDNIMDVATKLGIKYVPMIGVWTLEDAIHTIKEGIKSELRVDGGLAEGLVCKPHTELRDRRGRRIITKIKHRDYGIKEE